MSTTTSHALKSTSYQLRTLVSQALRSNNDDARVHIRRLLAFVNKTPLLQAEIERAPTPSVKVMDVWDQARNRREHLQFPDDQLEELGLLHALLTEFAKPTDDDFLQLCYFYGGVSDMKESLREVLDDICGRYGNHLRGVIEVALVQSNDPAYDSRRVEITMSGDHNQLNVAQDQARIHAAQMIGPDAAEIVRMARDLAAQAATHVGESEGATELEEAATAIAEAAQQPKPSRFTLRAAKEKLELLAGVASSLSSLAPHAQQLATLVGQWMASLPR